MPSPTPSPLPIFLLHSLLILSLSSFPHYISMAVEAPHLNLLTTQLFIASKELSKAMDAQPAMLGINCADKGLTFFSSNHPATFYNLEAAPSSSGLTVADVGGIGKKRSRESTSFLPDDHLTSLVHQHMLDLDRLLTVHTERVRSELAERRRQFARQLAAAAEDGILKRLMMAKDDEIERAKRLNWALEDQVHSLAAENQAWRELAQTNEAAANLLRANLEQVLAAELRGNEEEEQRCADAGDAESCCCGESDGPRGDTPPLLAAKARPACRSCGEGEPAVLLLPCRHLCLCSACGPAINSCPICKCSKKGSVNVNLA